MLHTKDEWIADFRSKGNQIVASLAHSSKSRKDKASEINKQIKLYRDQKLDSIKNIARSQRWENKHVIDEIMSMTYAYYIAMLESRNKVWPYDYMAFSRRIGELWEPFCKLAFAYPIKPLKIIVPPDFEKVQRQIRLTATEYIDSLSLSQDIKDELKRQYAIPWTMVDSGGIKLELDLHFEQNGIHYNCDFKSGFSSNEKGNTNRLLLVASIYHYLGSKERTLLFVRQKEDENNHYLQTLKNSPYWEVYCADDCYSAICEFTGFNIRAWLDNNANWSDDITPEFKRHLDDYGLLKYLTW